MGVRGTILTKLMPTPTALNQAQRTAFENTLREKLREVQRTLAKKETEARTTILQKLLKDRDADTFVNQIKACRDEIETTEKELNEKGFILGYRDEVRIADDSDLERQYEVMVGQLTKVEQSKVDALKEALTNSWQVGNLDQAKAMVAALALFSKINRSVLPVTHIDNV